MAKRPDYSDYGRKTALRLGSVLLVLALFSSQAARAQGWDPTPFRGSTPVPRDGLPGERKAFLLWLSQNASRLTPQQRQRVHERLYVYISQMAKGRGGRFPEAADTAAFELFRLAASMGVTGADRATRALHPNPEKLPVPESVPGFRLALRPPVFALTSDDESWGVCYPYYFMAAPAGRQKTSNGVLSEVAVLSTLFAPDLGPSGSSQATVLIVAAPLADSAKHVGSWIKQLGVSPAPPPLESAPGTWYASPAPDPMRRLAVVRRLPTRVLVVAYLGYAGTFEANRPHFFNLLSTLTPGRCTV